MGLRFVDGQSRSLEAGEVVTSTPFMALRVTGLIDCKLSFFLPSIIGRDSYVVVF